MTSAEARDDLLGLIGIEDPAHTSTVVLTRILADVNATQQKLFSMALPWWSQDPGGDMLRAPTPVSGLTFTSGSKTFSGTIQAWMVGCTIRIDGDLNDNEITSTTTLARPFVGVPAGTGIVFHDALTLPDTVTALQPPVRVLGCHELVGFRGLTDLAKFGETNYRTGNHGLYERIMGADRLRVETPVGYYIARAVVSGKIVNRVRFAPLPDREYTISWETKQKAQRVTALDSTVLLIPDDYAESIFLPMLRKAFSTWPHMALKDRKGEIDEQYKDAWAILNKLLPQPARIGRVSADVMNR